VRSDGYEFAGDYALWRLTTLRRRASIGWEDERERTAADMRKLELSFAMRVASEHLSYRSLIQEIEGDLELFRKAETTSTASLLRLLQSFQAQVQAHFALEEKGGLFEVYREHGPAFRRHAAAMLAQHQDFLARLRRILASVSTVQRPDSPEFEQCSRELGDLFRALRAHERAEDALLERLVEQDMGR